MINDLRILEEGRVVAVNAESRTYTVQTTHYTVDEIPYVANSGAIKSSGDEILKIWDRVLLYQSEAKPLILFRMPEGNADNTSHPPIGYTNVTPVTEAMVEDNLSDITYRTGGAFDVMQGDFVKYGPEGGVISILRGPVVKLGAGSLSQLQFHKMDDLTRLISRNVDVFTDFGEKRVYNDEGEVNVEVYGATQQFETMGSDRPGEEIGEHSPEDGKPRYRTEPYDRTGKWKIHAFAGWLGDNLRLFISRRGDSNHRLEKKPPVGLAEVIISHDGAIRVRSAREVVFEKVSRIRVPKKIREPHHNDKGDTAQRGGSYQPSLHKFYQWDVSDKAGRHLQYPEWHNHYVDHEEVRRFRDHSKDWYVESETLAELATKAKDLYEGQDEEQFEETSASFRIGNDGSIYAEDTWGSIFSMSNEDITFSARRDIKMHAGRDIQILGTREGTIRTQKDLDIISHDGSIRAKANTDLLLAADGGTASLDSGQGNVNLNSRQGDVLIRAERAHVFIKADAGDIGVVAVKGRVSIRSQDDLGLASDTAQVKIHGASKTQITSENNILLGVGNESPSLQMASSERNIDRFTNTPETTDESFLVKVNNLSSGSFLELSEGSAKLHGGSAADVSSLTQARVFIPEDSTLKMTTGGYTLSSAAGKSGAIIRDGNKEITQQDNDTEGGPNDTWNKGSSHASQSANTSSAEELVMVPADIANAGFAEGRFRYKGDIGVNRPIVKDEQEAVTEEDIEQMAPYSNYVEFEDGSFSFKDGVIPGKFTPTKQVLVPTIWEESPDSVGRLNLIPKETGEAGQSFTGDLERSDLEDPINSDVNFK